MTRKAGHFLRFDMSFDQLLVEDGVNADRWLASLAMYGEPFLPVFAAIWLPVESEVRERQFNLLPMGELPTRANVTEGGNFWSTTHIAVTGSLLVDNFCFIQVRERYPNGAPHSQIVTRIATPAGSEGEPTLLREQRLQCVDFCTFARGPSPLMNNVSTTTRLYVGVFHPQYGPIAWQAGLGQHAVYDLLEFRAGDAFDGLSKAPEHRAVLNGYARASKAIPDPRTNQLSFTHPEPTRNLLVHYQDDTFERWPNNGPWQVDFKADMSESFRGGTPVWGPIPISNLASAYEHLRNLASYDQWPIAIGTNGSGGSARACITFSRKGYFAPQPRKFYVVNGNEDAPDRIAFQWGGDVDLQTPAFGHFLHPAPSPQPPKPTPPRRPSSRLPPLEVDFDPVARAKNSAYYLNEIDQSVRDRMIRRGVRAASLAVGRNGKLVLARGYTMGEFNYPICRPSHRLRWGSVHKLVTAMMAVAESAAPGAENWLNTSIVDAHGLRGSEPTIRARLGNDAWERFEATTVANLLTFSSGWVPDFSQRDEGDGPRISYLTETFRTVKRLPLQPEDMRRFFIHTSKRFQESVPGRIYNYSNASFNSLTEMSSFRLRQNFFEYMKGLRGWLKFSRGVLRTTPPTRNDCIDFGEMLCAGPTYGRESLLPIDALREELEEEALPLHAPYAYTGGRDLELWTAGNLSTSAPAMTEILQSMHAGGTSWGRQLVTSQEFDRLSEPVELTTFEGEPETIAMGCDTSHTDFASAGPALTHATHITKGGDDPGCSSRADFFRLKRKGETIDISVAWTVALRNASLDRGTILDCVEALERQRYWENARDLFPDFTELAPSEDT